MDKISKLLNEIGLNDREVSVYLATLELGQSTVLPISKKSGIKRTYCYDILFDLQKKKLVSFIEENGRRRYFAEDPSKIEQTLKDRLKSFEGILPELRSIYNKPADKPKVRYFEGKEGIVSIYEEAQKTDELLAIGSAVAIYQNLGFLFDQHIEVLIKEKIKIREILTFDDKVPDYIGLYKKPLQEARFLPKEVKIATDMMIFGNKLAMISYEGNIHAVVIESSGIVDMQRKMFDIIWQTSKKI